MMSSALIVNPATPSQAIVQKLGVLLTKACLSSIPLASLVLDIGQVFVDVRDERAKTLVRLSNEETLTKFLECLAERIEKLETDDKARLNTNPAYECAAHAVLQTLLTESNQNVAKVLARAVTNLGKSTKESSYKAQCARIISELNEPMLHALQTNHRYHNSMLIAVELETLSGFSEQIERMARLLGESMSLPNWDSVMRRLMQLGLIENHEDQGFLVADREIVQTAPTTEFGIYVLGMCFDDVSKPVFGRFATQ